MRGPFTWSKFVDFDKNMNFRIADADDVPVAMCYVANQAKDIVCCLNRCWLADMAHPTFSDAANAGVIFKTPKRRSHDQ